MVCFCKARTMRVQGGRGMFEGRGLTVLFYEYIFFGNLLILDLEIISFPILPCLAYVSSITGRRATDLQVTLFLAKCMHFVIFYWSSV